MKDLPLLGSRASAGNWKLPALFLAFAGMMGPNLPLAKAATATTTTMTLTAEGSPVTNVEPRTAITLTTTVKAGATALKKGQVKFCDADVTYCVDNHVLGIAQLTAAGTAVLRFTPGTGSHSYKAVYLGSAGGATSTSEPSMVTVTGENPTSTSIGSTGGMGAYTLTSTVTGRGVGAAPTGAVYFVDKSNSNAVLGKGKLAPGDTVTTFSDSFYRPGDEPGPELMATADFNGDGKLDLVYTSGVGRTLFVLLGNGDGTFEVGTTMALPGDNNRPYPDLGVVGDFNDDGRPDLLLAQESSYAPSTVFLLGNGDGTFTAGDVTPNLGTRVRSMVAADFNGDGEEDLAVGQGEYNVPGFVTIFLGHGDATFTRGGQFTLRSRYAAQMEMGDFNGDGKTDLVLQPGCCPDRIDNVLLGKGDGTFALSIVTMPITVNALVVGDFNGDGITDLVGVGLQNSQLALRLGSTDGFLSKSIITEIDKLDTHYWESGLAGDFDGDGHLDLVIGDRINSNNPIKLLLGTGDGHFEAAVSKVTTVDEGAVLYATGDFDGDGQPDVAETGQRSTLDYRNTVLLNHLRHTATVAVSGKSPEGAGTHKVVARYAGDDTFASSASKPVQLTGLTGSAPVATLSALAVPFGDGIVGEPSNAKTVVLTNTGTAALAIAGLALSPVSGSGLSFASSNDCPASLAVGQSCKIRFRFVPGSAGGKASQLAITDNAGNSPQVISLTGTGTDDSK